MPIETALAGVRADSRMLTARAAPSLVDLGLRVALASSVIALLCVCALPPGRKPGSVPGAASALLGAEPAFVPATKAAPAPPPAPPARFGFAQPGPDPAHVAARIDRLTGLREDALTQGDVAAIEAPALRVTLTRGAVPDVAASLFVLMARRAAGGPAIDRPALSVLRTGSRGQIRTRFGVVETLELTFGGATLRTCTGFVTRDGAIRLDGWFCAPLGRPPEAQALACMLDALSFLDLADPETSAAFASAPQAPRTCPAPPPASEVSNRTGSIPQRSRNKK